MADYKIIGGCSTRVYQMVVNEVSVSFGKPTIPIDKLIGGITKKLTKIPAI